MSERGKRMINEQPTLLPWKLGPTQDTIEDANGVELLVLNVNDYGSDDPKPLPYAANAAFIVRAVNNHATLLQALKDVMAIHCQHPRNGEPWVDTAGRAAIAKAEEDK
jgi:hypothetical protein